MEIDLTEFIPMRMNNEEISQIESEEQNDENESEAD